MKDAYFHSPMKNFHIEYYLYNEETEIYELHADVIDAKQLAQAIIDNAYNKKFMFREVKEL